MASLQVFCVILKKIMKNYACKVKGSVRKFVCGTHQMLCNQPSIQPQLLDILHFGHESCMYLLK
jgi:hypothetical protein